MPLPRSETVAEPVIAEPPAARAAGAETRSPRARIERRDTASALTLFAAGLVIGLFFSRMGLMPMDHSIVFDGGWRILNGQVPWRDFVAPCGVVPAAMQAVFFGVLGTTWFAYCLHAAIVNGAFAVLTYALLALVGLPRPLAFFYALCATFFFYPPIGVPFLEQHSFFFTLAMITSAVAGNQLETERVQRVMWGAVPWLGALAFLSKQVPFSFTALVMPLVLIVPGSARVRTRLWGLAAGTVTLALVAAGLALALHIDWRLFVEYVIVRPAGVGESRASAAGLAHLVASRYAQLPADFDLTFIHNAVAIFWATLAAMPLAVLVWWAARRRGVNLTGDLGRLCTSVLLSPATYLSSLALGLTAKNQMQNSMAFYPVAAGLLHASLWTEFQLAERGLGWVLTRLRPGLDEAAATRQGARLAGATALVFAALSVVPVAHWVIDTSEFTTTIDETRFVNDMRFDPTLAASSRGHLPPGMGFLRWTSSSPEEDPAAWTTLVEFLRTARSNFLIIGDNLMTYGLVGRPSIAPNLWFHPGLTLPAPSEPAFAGYQTDLIGRIAREDVRYVVVEQRRTLGLSLDDMPIFRQWLQTSWCRTHTFGIDQVYEPCPSRPK